MHIRNQIWQYDTEPKISVAVNITCYQAALSPDLVTKRLNYPNIDLCVFYMFVLYYRTQNVSF